MSNSSSSSKTPDQKTALTTDRLKAEMAAESRAEFYISPGSSEQAAIRAALQNDEEYKAAEAPRPATPQTVRQNQRPRAA